MRGWTARDVSNALFSKLGEAQWSIAHQRSAFDAAHWLRGVEGAFYCAR